MSGRAPSLSQARMPKAIAQAAVNPRKPEVAAVRRRRSTTAPNVPTASPVSTVQLMKARFCAICVADTSRV